MGPANTPAHPWSDPEDKGCAHAATDKPVVIGVRFAVQGAVTMVLTNG